MTIGTPAMWAGSATHPVRVARNAASTYLGTPMISHANSATATTRGGGYGVAGGGDLAVTTTGGLGYSIAAGHFALPGTFATAQGGYVDYNDAAVAGTLPARDATNPYIAYICARVRDTDEDATGSEITDFAVVQGTPAASPAAPAVPSALGSLLIISEALVPSVANGGPVVFTERRKYLNAIGGIQRVTSGSRPSGAALWEGLYFDESDTNRLYRYDGAASVLIAGRCGFEGSNPTAGPLVSSTNADIGYTAETYDTDAFHAGTSATITIPFAGIYVVHSRVIAAAFVSTQCPVQLKFNGGGLTTGYILAAANQVAVGMTVVAAAGDTIAVNITNNHSATISFNVVTTVNRISD